MEKRFPSKTEPLAMAPHSTYSSRLSSSGEKIALRTKNRVFTKMREYVRGNLLLTNSFLILMVVSCFIILDTTPGLILSVTSKIEIGMNIRDIIRFCQ